MSQYPAGGYPSYAQPGLPPAPQPPAEPRRYSYFGAIFRAPFSASLWRDVGQRWRGIGLLYMLLLLFLTWALCAIKYQVSFAHFVNNEAPRVVEQIPAITITNGVVSAQCPQPYTITNPQNGQVLAIIDTTGTVTQPPPATPSLLLTRTHVIARNRPGETRSYDLSGVKNTRIDQQRLNDVLYAMKYWFIPVGALALLIFSFIWRLILLLIFGGIAMAMASAWRARIDFPGAMRLAAISMTPAILLNTIWTLSGLPSLGCIDLLIPIGLTIVYLILTVKANAPQSVTPGGFEVTTPRANPL